MIEGIVFRIVCCLNGYITVPELIILSASSIKAVASRDHFVGVFFVVFLVSDGFAACTSRLKTTTHSWSRFCSVNCRPTTNNYQFSHLRSGREVNPDLKGGSRECYHSTTVAPVLLLYTKVVLKCHKSLCLDKIIFYGQCNVQYYLTHVELAWSHLFFF